MCHSRLWQVQEQQQQKLKANRKGGQKIELLKFKQFNTVLSFYGV